MDNITGEQLIKLVGDKDEITLIVECGWRDGTHKIKLMKGKDDMFIDADLRRRFGDNGIAWFMFSELRDGGWTSRIAIRYLEGYRFGWCLGGGLSEGLRNMKLVLDNVTLYDLL